MKINPITFMSNKHNVEPPKVADEGVKAPVQEKDELYSSQDSIAVKNIYGSTIETTKAKLKKEAEALLDMRHGLFDKAYDIKQECIKLLEDDVDIRKHAAETYQKAYDSFIEIAKFEEDSRNGYYQKSVGGQTNLFYFDKGKLTKIMLNVRPDGDKLVAEDTFKYLRGNVIYQQNAVSKDGETLSADKEYYYIKGEMQKYDKGIKITDKGRQTEETRLYKKGRIFYMAQNINDEMPIKTTDRIFYFDDDGFDAYVENMTETPQKNVKEKIYDYTYGYLTHYMENQVWSGTKSNTDLKMEFRDDRLHEAFINSEMSMSSFMTADKQFKFENNVPKKAILGYERSSIGTETSKKEVDL